jgi:GntR family transcriptional regulator
MPIEPGPVKYVLIVNAIQARIENGTYPIGTKVPSEADLVREFGASRSTVVRALGLLRQQGWLEGQQGIGRVVLGRPPIGGRRIPAAMRALVGAEDPATVTLLSAGVVRAPRLAAAALGVPAGASVVARRRLVTAAQLGPVEMTTVYARPELAERTMLGASALIDDDLLRHVARRAGAICDHLAVRISSRLPEPAEVAALKILRRDCLTAVLVTARDHGARPLLVVDAVLATNRRALEVAFPAQ